MDRQLKLYEYVLVDGESRQKITEGLLFSENLRQAYAAAEGVCTDYMSEQFVGFRFRFIAVREFGMAVPFDYRSPD